MSKYVLHPLLAFLVGTGAVAALLFWGLWMDRRRDRRSGRPVPKVHPSEVLGLLAFAVLAGAVVGFIGAAASYSQREHDQAEAKEAAAQAAMHKAIEGKYRVLLDPSVILPLSGADQPAQVVARVDGQPRQCSVQIVKKDPFVFCGNGVEADRVTE